MADRGTLARNVEDWEYGGFGLYLHWPFCQSKCPYCDFNSHVAPRVDQIRWGRAYLAEIERLGAQTQGRLLHSIFFGGGTPSLMEPELVDAILRQVRATWSMANDIEITLEANPTSVEAGRFAGYRAAGVNRVSIGVQALSDTDLRALGRIHSVEDALAAVEVAQQTFDRVSFDLIYSRQNQTLGQWELELQRAIGLKVDHLSLYQLTIEDGTAFGDRYAIGKLRGLPDDDLAADMYALTQELTERAGLCGYEVSNHARRGHESRHNRIYWMYGDYVGIGPGAHGRLTLAGQRQATFSPKNPTAWLNSVEKQGCGEVTREILSRADQFSEAILMGLRLRDGISLDRIEKLGQVDLSAKIAYLTDLGMVEVVDRHLRATVLGRPVLNAVLREVLAN